MLMVILTLYDALQELGYDAFIGENSNNIKGLEIVVFNSDQIIRKQSTKTDVAENETTETAKTKNAQIEINITEPVKDIDNFFKSFNKGEKLTLNEVKQTIEYIFDNKEVILADLNKLKIADLKKIVGPYTNNKVKADFVDSSYTQMLVNSYYALSNDSSLTITLDNTPYEEKVRNKVKSLLENLTQEKLDKLQADKKTAYEERVNKSREFADRIKILLLMKIIQGQENTEH